MKSRPALGTFRLGLSYGLPAGVAVAALFAIMSDDPNTGAITRVGIIVAIAVALVAGARAERTSHDQRFRSILRFQSLQDLLGTSDGSLRCGLDEVG